MLNEPPAITMCDAAAACQVLDHMLAASTVGLTSISCAFGRVPEFHNLPRDDVTCNVRHPRLHGGLEIEQVTGSGARAVAILQRAQLPIVI